MVTLAQWAAQEHLVIAATAVSRDIAVLVFQVILVLVYPVTAATAVKLANQAILATAAFLVSLDLQAAAVYLAIVAFRVSLVLVYLVTAAHQVTRATADLLVQTAHRAIQAIVVFLVSRARLVAAVYLATVAFLVFLALVYLVTVVFLVIAATAA